MDRPRAGSCQERRRAATLSSCFLSLPAPSRSRLFCVTHVLEQERKAAGAAEAIGLDERDAAAWSEG